VRVEELAGQRIRAVREDRDMTQEELGRRLGKLLGREWPRQAVSAAERGRRAFTAAELVAIALTLRTSVGHLLTPPFDVDSVDLPGSVQIRREDLAAVVLPSVSADETLAGVAETVNRIQKNLGQVTEGTGMVTEATSRLWEDMQALGDELTRAFEAVGRQGGGS
jgi:transcriptional regulator with XRE-family HTH domain